MLSLEVTWPAAVTWKLHVSIVDTGLPTCLTGRLMKIQDCGG